MKHVVFCYARGDKEEMNELLLHFQNQKITVWTDENISRSSEDWPGEFERAIDSSFAVVVLMSPSAKKSGWVRKEIAYAKIQGKSIFPVLIKGDGKSSIPLELITANHTNLVGIKGKARAKKIKYLKDGIIESKIILLKQSKRHK